MKPNIIIKIFLLTTILTTNTYAQPLIDLLQSPTPTQTTHNTKLTQKERLLRRKHHITTQEYTTDKVYHINLSTFISTTIIIPADENIISYKLGDGQYFAVEHNNDIPNIITLNTMTNGYLTNLTLISKDHTSKQNRVYNFLLKSQKDNSNKTPNLTYKITKNKKEILTTLKQSNKHIKNLVDITKLNRNYKIKGDKAIAPKFVYDDGKFTYLDFGNNFKSDRLPTVYKVTDKRDNIINNKITEKDNIIIIESLSLEEGFILKNGDKHVCIKPTL
jgi:type IV secretion system protein VirB9